MHLFYHPDPKAGVLSPEESRHVKTLRLRQGDAIELCDGHGSFFHAAITKLDPHGTSVVIQKQVTAPGREYSIHLAIAPTKNMDRMEWMVEKCTEVGVNKISFIQCQTSERKKLNLDRLFKIAVNAMKQSQQAWLPELVGISELSKFLADCTEPDRFIANVDETNPHHLSAMAKPKGHYAILIGPEGDFVEHELDMAQGAGFVRTSLGPTRLRTETAGLYGVIALNMINNQSTSGRN